MHDLFDIVGLPRSASAVEVRRVCARLTRRTHPDFVPARDTAGDVAVGDLAANGWSPGLRDVAVDFIDMASVLDSIQSSFFRGPDSRTL